MLHPILTRNLTLKEFERYLSLEEIGHMSNAVMREMLDEAYYSGYDKGYEDKKSEVESFKK